MSSRHRNLEPLGRWHTRQYITIEMWLFSRLEWARERLISQHRVNPEYNYLLQQKKDDVGNFEILVYMDPHPGQQTNSQPVVQFIVNLLPNGQYQVLSCLSAMVKLMAYWIRAIPCKKLLGGCLHLTFRTTLPRFFFIWGYPAVISENISIHPAAISAKQVGPPPTLQFYLFRCTLQWVFLAFTTINPMKWGGWKKLTIPQYSALIENLRYMMVFRYINTTSLCLIQWRNLFSIIQNLPVICSN